MESSDCIPTNSSVAGSESAPVSDKTGQAEMREYPSIQQVLISTSINTRSVDLLLSHAEIESSGNSGEEFKNEEGTFDTLLGSAGFGEDIVDLFSNSDVKSNASADGTYDKEGDVRSTYSDEDLDTEYDPDDPEWETISEEVEDSDDNDMSEYHDSQGDHLEDVSDFDESVELNSDFNADDSEWETISEDDDDDNMSEYHDSQGDHLEDVSDFDDESMEFNSDFDDDYDSDEWMYDHLENLGFLGGAVEIVPFQGAPAG